MKKTIAFNSIRIDGGTQQRAEINTEVVAEYQAAYESGHEMPPMRVFFDGVHHWLAGGFHRFHAQARLNVKEVTVDCTDGTLEDAILFAVGDNSTHGLRRTNADKRKAVMTMLTHETWRNWADHAIAAKCAVDQKTVSRYRAELASIRGNSSDATRTFTRGGQTYQMDTSVIAASNRANKTKPAETPTTVATPPDTSAQQPGPVPTTKPDPAAGQAPAKSAEPRRAAAPASAASSSESGGGHAAQQQDVEDDGPDLVAELEAAHLEIERLTALVKVAEANDAKAEALKWRQIADAAQRSESEAMDRAAKKDKELQFQARILQRIGKALDEDDFRKLGSKVVALARESAYLKGVNA
jgi:hypothetical protein